MEMKALLLVAVFLGVNLSSVLSNHSESRLFFLYNIDSKAIDIIDYVTGIGN